MVELAAYAQHQHKIVRKKFFLFKKKYYIYIMAKITKKASTKLDMSKYSEKNPVPTEYCREWKMGTRWNEKTYGWYLECKLCGQMQRSSYTAHWVICSTCTNEMVPWEDTLPKTILKERNKASQKPQGWHFMKEFVDQSGNVFHKGKEQPDLKGKLQPTIIKKKEKLSKKEKEQIRQTLNKEIYDLKQKLKKARWKKDKVIIERQIRKKEKGLK
jgi:hypothetical protein